MKRLICRLFGHRWFHVLSGVYPEEVRHIWQCSCCDRHRQTDEPLAEALRRMVERDSYTRIRLEVGAPKPSARP